VRRERREERRDFNWRTEDKEIINESASPYFEIYPHICHPSSLIFVPPLSSVLIISLGAKFAAISFDL
jgi:hypothetical protein